MANFPTQPVLTLTPTAIADLVVTLRSPDPRGDEQPSASYQVGVLYSSGEIRELRGDLVPYLTTQEINSLLAFLATLRTRAAGQLLP